MRKWRFGMAMLWLVSLSAMAQDAISVTGTLIPQQLLVQNYGNMPKGVAGYDLSICNVSPQKQTVVSTQIFQALVKSNISLMPIGRQIMLASILRNQTKSVTAILNIALGAATGTVALLSTSSTINLPNGLKTTVGVSSIVLGELSNSLKPVLEPDKVEKFEREALESALVLDTGSCVERTLFASSGQAAAGATQVKPAALQFHVK
jgi:hypothetical protein